jgi:RluA family pseudouridine synthase
MSARSRRGGAPGRDAGPDRPRPTRRPPPPTLLEIAPDEAGRTLQALLHDRLACSHSEAKGLIDDGAVRRLDDRRVGKGRTGPESGPPTGKGRAGAEAGHTAKQAPIPSGAYAHRVAAGERYEIRRDAGRRYRPQARPRPGEGFRVVHQDRDILLVDKQTGLLSVPTDRSEEDSLVERLLDEERRRGVRHPALFAMHRLDRDTSGLLLFARTRPAFEHLQGQFNSRTVDRHYLAVASGRVVPDEGKFESFLEEDPKTLKVRSTKQRGAGKYALTEYKVVERLPRATVLAVRIHTGRKNQIRVHLSEAGHPLIGDRRYGAPSPLIDRTALHARALAFDHPATGKRLTFDSDPPRDLRHLIKALRRGADPAR